MTELELILCILLGKSRALPPFHSTDDVVVPTVNRITVTERIKLKSSNVGVRGLLGSVSVTVTHKINLNRPHYKLCSGNRVHLYIII